MKRRMVVVAGALALWAAAIEARLVYLQVISYERLSARAAEQQSARRSLPARRGDILDRQGAVLARSVDLPVIVANPEEIVNRDAAAEALCRVLAGGCSAARRTDLRQRLGRRGNFAYLSRTASLEEARQVRDLRIKGIGYEFESRRTYPNRDLAAHVLGYVGVDNKGLGGIEHAYDEQVRGREGSAIVRKRANGETFASTVEQAPTAGDTLELTISAPLQHIVQRELRDGVLENGAKAGSAVVLDPQTGEVLALANVPTFNPNAIAQVGEDALRNRAVQDLYEPGSTIKIVTASAALEHGVVTPEEMIDVSDGRIAFGPDDVVSDTRNYGRLSFQDVIAKSSNVGAIKVALELGANRLTEALRRFGFGRRSSPADFPSEAEGIVWPPEKLTDRALARVSIGYHIAVTPLQMAAAVAAVANGGELIQPRVVRAFIRGGRRHPEPRTVKGRAMTPKAAAQLTAMMEEVVEHGTATFARIAGYTVAGKTGTATKWADGGYVKSEHNASFVGFVPSRAPAFVIVVVIDSPTGRNGYYGGPVAGPIFKRIAEAALRQAGIPPSLNAAPPLLVRTPQPGVQQVPASGPVTAPLAARPPERLELDGRVPDLTGLSARHVVRVLSRLGVSPRVQGLGLATQQRPAAGSPIEAGGVVTVWLDRRLPPGPAPARVP
jgi:cell division protein FtsI (penicillin-binding protein 3)